MKIDEGGILSSRKSRVSINIINEDEDENMTHPDEDNIRGSIVTKMGFDTLNTDKIDHSTTEMGMRKQS